MKKFDPDFVAYYKTPEWKEKVKKRRAIDGYRCVLCGSNEDLQVHHRHYHSFRHEDVENDLVTLCQACHTRVHAYKDFITCGICDAALILNIKDHDAFLNSIGIKSYQVHQMHKEFINSNMKRICIPLEKGALVIPYFSGSGSLSNRDREKMANYLGLNLSEIVESSKKLYSMAFDSDGFIDDLPQEYRTGAV